MGANALELYIQFYHQNMFWDLFFHPFAFYNVHHPASLLVLDISMPYLDGIGVMERLNEMETKPRVIVLTAFEQESMIMSLEDLWREIAEG